MKRKKKKKSYNLITEIKHDSNGCQPLLGIIPVGGRSNDRGRAVVPVLPQSLVE